MRSFGLVLIALGIGSISFALAFPVTSLERDAQAHTPAVAQANLVPDVANRGAPFFAGAVMLLGGVAIIAATRTEPVKPR